MRQPKFSIKLNYVDVVRAFDEEQVIRDFIDQVVNDTQMDANTWIMEHLVIEQICIKCGVTLNLDEEKIDCYCVQCNNR